jgi:hypothetical protein
VSDAKAVRHEGGAGECISGLRPPCDDGERERFAAAAAPRVHSTHFQVERVLLLFEAADVDTEYALLGQPRVQRSTATPRIATRAAKLLSRRLSASSAFSLDSARRKNP